MKKKILITSALPYTNNICHLGTLEGCILPGDIFNRYYKLIGRDTMFICGTDDYGPTSEIRASQEGLTPQQICEKYHKIHFDIYKWFNINFSYFGKTSTYNPRCDKWAHTNISQDIFKKLDDNGFLFEKEMEQLFCEDIDMFVAGRFITGNCPKCNYDKSNADQCDQCGVLLDSLELINPRYKLNPSYKLIPKKTKHLFLDLPKLQPELLEWFNKVKMGWTDNAISITEAWLRDGLKPRCITRDNKWGTPVPKIEKYGSTYDNKIMYGWFDAPIGYMSITSTLLNQMIEDEDEMESNNLFTSSMDLLINKTKDLCIDNEWYSWWKDPEVELLHTFAKDNIPFHTIIFPATCIGTRDNYTLASRICSSEYLTFNGNKFSKSENKGIFGDQIIIISQSLDINEDYWRYYLTKIRPEKHDSSFTWEGFINSINSDLVNCYGNLINRCFNMINRFCNGKVTIPKNKYISYDDKINNLLNMYHCHFNKLEIKDPQNIAIELSNIGNKFLQIIAPWKLYKKNKTDPEIQDCLAYCLWIVYWATSYLEPFIPNTCMYINSFIQGTENINPLMNPNIFKDVPENLNLSIKQDKYIFPFKPLLLDDVVEKLNELNIPLS